MAAIPPVLLVLDIGALSAATPREWLEFSRVGNCIIPQVVYEEMKFLFDRSPDPDLERIAKAFNRFYPTSGWQTNETIAPHALLKTATNQALTRRARISLTVGKCAYAVSQSSPHNLVVLVSSDRSMLQRIYDIQAPNLCAVTGPSLLQWCRTGQRPIAVSQKLQQLRMVIGSQAGSTTASNLFSAPVQTSPSRITSTPSRITSTSNTKLQSPKTTLQPASPLQDVLPQVFSFVSALVALTVAGAILFYIFQSAKSQNYDWTPNTPNTEQNGS